MKINNQKNLNLPNFVFGKYFAKKRKTKKENKKENKK
jgi:hypothetical protein